MSRAPSERPAAGVPASGAPATGRRVHRSLLFLAAGLILIGAIMLWDSLRLASAGGYSGVGPATFPRIIGAGLVGLGVWTVIAALRRDFPDPQPSDPKPILWILAGLTAQLLLLKIAGFSIATALLFAFTARAFGKRNLAATIPAGFILAFAVWALFSQVLMLNLPAGPIENAVFGAAP